MSCWETLECNYQPVAALIITKGFHLVGGLSPSVCSYTQNSDPLIVGRNNLVLSCKNLVGIFLKRTYGTDGTPLSSRVHLPDEVKLSIQSPYLQSESLFIKLIDQNNPWITDYSGLIYVRNSHVTFVTKANFSCDGGQHFILHCWVLIWGKMCRNYRSRKSEYFPFLALMEKVLTNIC